MGYVVDSRKRKGTSDGERDACAANLRQLDEAKAKWASANNKRVGDTPFAVHIADYLPGGKMPA